MKNRVIAALLAGLIFITALPMNAGAATSGSGVATWGKESIHDADLEMELINLRSEYNLSHKDEPIGKTDSDFYKSKVDEALINVIKRLIQKQKAEKLKIEPTLAEVDGEYRKFLKALAVECGSMKEDQTIDNKTVKVLEGSPVLEEKCISLYNMSKRQYTSYYIWNNLYFKKVRSRMADQLDKQLAVAYPVAAEHYNGSREEFAKIEKRLQEIQEEEWSLILKQKDMSDVDKARCEELYKEEKNLTRRFEEENFHALNNGDKTVDEEFSKNLFIMIEKMVNRTNERKCIAQINLSTTGLNEIQTGYLKYIGEAMLKQLENGASIIQVSEAVKQQLVGADYEDEDQRVACIRVLESLSRYSGYTIYEKNKSSLIPEIENDTDRSSHLIDKLYVWPEGFSIIVIEKTIAANEAVPLEWVKKDSQSYEVLRDLGYELFLRNGFTSQRFVKNDGAIDKLIKRMTTVNQNGKEGMKP